MWLLFLVGGVQSGLQQLDEGLWLGALRVPGDGKGKASLGHSERGMATGALERAASH